MPFLFRESLISSVNLLGKDCRTVRKRERQGEKVSENAE